MSDKLTLLCPIIAAPGKGSKLAKRLVEVAKCAQAEPGNICYIPHATDNPDEFIIYEQWSGDEAMDYHMKQTYLIEFLEDRDQLLAGNPQGRRIFEL